MKKILIIIGACMNNRGSEALVRGTIEIIQKKITNCVISLSSAESDFTSKINLPFVNQYINRSWSFLFDGLFKVILKMSFLNKVIGKLRYINLLKVAKQSDLVIVVGADNYCLGRNLHLYAMNFALRDVSRKMLMYDCSLKPEKISTTTYEDFSLFDGITARDKNTFIGFADKFPNKSIYYHPDPAFVMPFSEIRLPKGFEIGNTIGINLSTMVLMPRYCTDRELVISNFRGLITWILNNTLCKVILLPHVMQRKDLSALEELYNYFKDNQRIILMNDESLNAAQLKFIISNCKMFVGARTHATIAAYSSYVPTLVFGYSEKSVEIAKDLFGTDEGYVIAVQSLRTENDLQICFSKLFEKEKQVRSHLLEIMPIYTEKVWIIGEIINQQLQ